MGEMVSLKIQNDLYLLEWHNADLLGGTICRTSLYHIIVWCGTYMGLQWGDNRLDSFEGNTSSQSLCLRVVPTQSYCRHPENLQKRHVVKTRCTIASIKQDLVTSIGNNKWWMLRALYTLRYESCFVQTIWWGNSFLCLMRLLLSCCRRRHKTLRTRLCLFCDGRRCVRAARYLGRYVMLLDNLTGREVVVFSMRRGTREVGR